MMGGMARRMQQYVSNNGPDGVEAAVQNVQRLTSRVDPDANENLQVHVLTRYAETLQYVGELTLTRKRGHLTECCERIYWSG